MNNGKQFLLEKLGSKEAIEKSILDEFHDKLTRTFQIVFEIEGEVDWKGIQRFSHTSNFVTINGNAFVKKGTPLSSEKFLESDMEFYVNFIFPLSALHGATPYQLADMFQTISVFKQIVDPKKYFDLMKDENFTMEQLEEYLPDNDSLVDMMENKNDTYKDDNIKLDYDFDLNELTESQKEKLSLTKFFEDKH